MKRTALDIYDEMPMDMKRYIKNYGWNFNRKACDFAVSLMMKRDPVSGKIRRVEPWSKEKVEQTLTAYGIELENNNGYNHVYVANKCIADNYKGSVQDEEHLAMYVKETIDDVDAADGEIMRMWYASMVARGEVVMWDDLL